MGNFIELFLSSRPLMSSKRIYRNKNSNRFSDITHDKISAPTPSNFHKSRALLWPDFIAPNNRKYDIK